MRTSRGLAWAQTAAGVTSNHSPQPSRVRPASASSPDATSSARPQLVAGPLGIIVGYLFAWGAASVLFFLAVIPAAIGFVFGVILAVVRGPNARRGFCVGLAISGGLLGAWGLFTFWPIYTGQPF